MKKNFCSLSHIQLAFGFTLLVSGVAIGQMSVITGTVTENSKPVSGVSVFQQGSDVVSVSDGSGIYRVQVTGENPVLVFKHPEHPEQIINVKDQNTVNVSLYPKERQIDEVILNGGYYKVKQQESTGSIAKVTAKELEDQPTSNVLSSMQGRMSGVNIVQNSGTPGGGYDIQIRGKNSLRREGNSPLYIIDGVPAVAGNVSNTALSASILPYGETNPLNMIDPSDIESIEVLKDADANAIYGSRGSNGVVLVSTKKGKKGKLSLQYNTSFSAGELINRMKLMNTEEYLGMRREAFVNDKILTYPASAYDLNGVWDQSRNTDWQKELLGKTATKTNHQFSISGGSQLTQYLISLGYYEETTLYKGDFRFRKMSGLVNINHQSENKKFNVTYSGTFNYLDNLLPGTDLYSTALTLAPNAPSLYNADGSLNWQNNTFTNPLAQLYSNYRSKTDLMNHNLSMGYVLVDKLKLVMNSGLSMSSSNENRVLPSTTFNPSFNFGSERSSVTRFDQKLISYIVEPRLEYSNKWNDHSIDVLGGATFQKRSQSSIYLSASNFLTNELLGDLSSALTKNIVSQPVTEYAYQSFYARLGYQYKSRYILNLTARRDGSSRFGADKRYGNFGAVGAAWSFSKESWLDNVPWLSFGKLRGSFGITGSDQIGDYQYLDTYTTTTAQYNQTSGLEPSRLFNPLFGWENNKKWEAALESGFLDSRISFTLSWYRNRSGNQLVGIPLPGTTGFTSIQSNLPALVENKGWEIDLSADIFRKTAFKWNTSVNLSIPKNRLLSFPGLEGSTYANTYAIGYSTSVRKLYEYTGINPATGLFTFRDVNGDGVLNISDRTTVKDVGVKYFGGLNSNLQYKNWSLDVLFQYVKQTSINYIAQSFLPGGLYNLPAEMLDVYSNNNTSADFQIYSTGSNAAANTAYNNYKLSDQIVSDGSFIRLKMVNLSYSNSINGVLSFKVFVTGQNLLTWTKYFGPDPEFALSGYTPPLKSYTLGFQLNF